MEQKNEVRPHISALLEKRERKAHLIDEITLIYFEDTVNIRLDSLEDVFCKYDPARPENRSIDQDVEAYILEQLDHFSPKSRVQVNFMVPQAEKYSQKIIQDGFSQHFKTRAEEQLIINKTTGFRWLRNLFLGIIFLTACLVAAHFLSIASNTRPFFAILSESLSIVGWVALWEPACYFLYGSQDGHKLLHYYMRLHHAHVAVIELDKIDL